jgi:hypothetical protein
MNNDTIKIQQIKGYTMLIRDIQELIYKYNELANKEKITDITHETAHEQLTMLKSELINYIELIVNK